MASCGGWWTHDLQESAIALSIDRASFLGCRSIDQILPWIGKWLTAATVIALQAARVMQINRRRTCVLKQTLSIHIPQRISPCPPSQPEVQDAVPDVRELGDIPIVLVAGAALAVGEAGRRELPPPARGGLRVACHEDVLVIRVNVAVLVKVGTTDDAVVVVFVERVAVAAVDHPVLVVITGREKVWDPICPVLVPFLDLAGVIEDRRHVPTPVLGVVGPLLPRAVTSTRPP